MKDDISNAKMGGVGYRKYYKMHGKTSPSEGISSHKGLCNPDDRSGFTNPSTARTRVKLANGKSAFAD